jgi:hypothetical protein
MIVIYNKQKEKKWAQVDTHIGRHVEQASQLRFSLSTLNNIVKNHKEIWINYIWCGPFSKQQKLVKRLLLEKLEFALAVWFKQARENKASIGGTHHKEKALHITAHLGITSFSDCKDGLTDVKGDTFVELLSCESRSVDPETVEDWKSCQLLLEIEGYNLCDIM